MKKQDSDIKDKTKNWEIDNMKVGNQKSLYVITPGLIIILIVLVLYLSTRNNQNSNSQVPNNYKTSESTDSTDNNTHTHETFAQYEIPIKYWSHDTNPAYNIKVAAPEVSIFNKDEETSPILQLSDGSMLTFGISHYAEIVELDENILTSIETDNYENTFRYEDRGKMIYAEVTIEGDCGTYEKLVDNENCTTELVKGICRDKETITIQAPCGAPVFHDLILSCTTPNNDYSLCDKVIKTILIEKL